MIKLVIAFCNFAKAPKNDVRENTRTIDINIKMMHCLYEYNN
jgi:hypothetical protein